MLLCLQEEGGGGAGNIIDSGANAHPLACCARHVADPRQTGARCRGSTVASITSNPTESMRIAAQLLLETVDEAQSSALSALSFLDQIRSNTRYKDITASLRSEKAQVRVRFSNLGILSDYQLP